MRVEIKRKSHSATTLIRFEESFHSPSIEAFIDNYLQRRLKYYARDLMAELGYDDVSQLENTVKRVSCLLKTLEIPMDQNLKVIYRSEGDKVYQDWILSPLAYFMLTINGPSTNPSTAQAQLNLFARYMRRKFDADAS